MTKNALSESWKMVCCILGVFLYAAAYRIILVPFNLYSGSFTGIAQILQTAVRSCLPIPLPADADFTGIFLWIMNIPLCLLAWKIVSRTFFLKTVVTVCLQSLFMSVIPIPAVPVISDTLTCCIIGGAVSGFGVGLTLKYGSSGGGMDIVGICCAKHFPDFSVGKLTLMVNLVIYLFSALYDSLETAVYSALFCWAASFVMDKVHDQNIMVCAMIITKNQNIKEKIIHVLNRSCTIWEGKGGYSQQNCHIIMAVVSKYEFRMLKRIIHTVDPGAFITFHNQIGVSGNFEKRFDA